LISDQDQQMSDNQFDNFTKGSEAEQNENYVLRLYITGMSPNCRRAVENTKNICEKYLKDKYILEIIDLYQELHVAALDQIIAAPTLVKALPAPKKIIIGDMSNTEKVLKALGIILS